jgi:Xaa-Pro aminopeptidase
MTTSLTDLMKNSETLLMLAESEHDANMLYATAMFVPDPFIYFRNRGRSYIVMSDLETDRAKKQAPHCQVLSLSRYQKQLREEGLKRPGFADVICRVFIERRIRQARVPQNFPFGLASDLQRRKIRVKPLPEIFPQREFKSPAEVAKLSDALRMSEAGMEAGIRVLRASKIRGRSLLYQGTPLTSERLRAAIDKAIIDKGGLASHTIVAGGEQGCDPHDCGHGPLRANEPIILDIFPRSQSTGYFGDLTRTVVRGRASEAVRRLYATVQGAQKAAFRAMRPGVPTMDIHKTVQEFFQREGYKTGKKNGRMQGFFHGTGHGLGLEIHEQPRMGPTSPGKLKAGQVITVEPGLYYPGVGGVRLEDVALLTAKGNRNLTRCPQVLEI